jgi:multiple sugar transport system substrate-binding protein
MKKYVFPLMIAALALVLAACTRTDRPSPKNPVTVTMWHNYVEGMRDRVDNLINEFNMTEGAANGITVKVTFVAEIRILREQLLAAANNDLGVPALPDMALVYPYTAKTLAERGLLADLSKYLTQQQLDSFVPQFIEEGRLEAGGLYTFPVNKSIEVLYVNRTQFDRFSNATGISVEKLATFEGLAEAAEEYCKWSGGKAFFFPEELFNMTTTGFRQMGADFLKNQSADFSNPIFKRIWDCYYTSAVTGGTAVQRGYGNNLMVTGDIVCAIGSSAGATFYQPWVIYSDNTEETIVCEALPYPVFDGGEKSVIHLGAGICVTKSQPIKEKAAVMFLDWFTETERNLEFCAGFGYLPVRKAAFDSILAGNVPVIENELSKKIILLAAQMYKDYHFYFPPAFDGYETLRLTFNDRLLQTAREGREYYLRTNAVPQDAMENFIREF